MLAMRGSDLRYQRYKIPATHYELKPLRHSHYAGAILPPSKSANGTLSVAAAKFANQYVQTQPAIHYTWRFERRLD